jgi:hypothetical protein
VSGAGEAAAEASPKGKAAHIPTDSRTPAGSGSAIAANSSSITVELPAGAAAAAAPAAVGFQHTGYMTLTLKGGGDVPPKKVMLYGELPASLMKFAVKEINLGPVPLFEQQTALAQIKNLGSTDAAYGVSTSRRCPIFHFFQPQQAA